MFARFARIGVGHQIQYVLPNVTDDEIVAGNLGNDGEPLDEGDLEFTMSNIIESGVDDQQNQALEENTTDEEEEDDEWDDEDEVASMTNSDDEDFSSEDYGESEDEGPDFKF